MLTVGIPKEIKPREKRVGLVPKAVCELTKAGFKVLVEKDAGLASGYSDKDYKAVGAEIVSGADELYARAEFIQKVKEPQKTEIPLLRKGQILFSFLHLASPENQHLIKVLCRSEVTAIGYETLEVDGRMKILAPMSCIAGGLSAAFSVYFRSLALGRENRLVYPADFQAKIEEIASHYPSISNLPKILGETVIFGGGSAGRSALEVALALGGVVKVIDKNKETRDFVEHLGAKAFAPQENFESECEKAEVLIGAYHVRGERAPQALDPPTLERISRRQKKIIFDIAIDQGGNFPEAHSTTYDDPLYFDSYGNVRFAVANIPSLCGQAASKELSEASLSYTRALALHPAQAFAKFPELAKAVNIQAGRVTLASLKN